MMKTGLMPIIDGHNDTLKKVFLLHNNLLSKWDGGHIDLARARKAGLKGGFFGILAIAENVNERKFGYGLNLNEEGWKVAYPKPLRQKYAEKFTNDVMNYFFNMIDGNNEVKVVKNFAEISRYLEKDILSVILHFEGAEAICENLSNLEFYYNKGLRSLGLVWSRANAFGYGVPFKLPCSPDVGPGLTKAGKELVHKCNELGIIIDLTHLNEKGFFDVKKLTKAPLVVSHAAAHSICRSSTNLTDYQIDTIKDSNGIIGILFDVLNTRPDGNFIVDTPLDVIIQHIDYVVNRIGIEHVALGSDFDGGQMPLELHDVTGMPEIFTHLKKLGYSIESIENIAYKNWLRVIKDTWKNN